jgi:hypothetical protein
LNLNIGGSGNFLFFCSKIPFNAHLLWYLLDVIAASWFKKELILVAAHMDFGPVNHAG